MSVQIMPLQYVTHHVFQWICHSSEIDVDALIDEAFDTAEQAPSYEIGDGSVALVVKSRLAALLEEKTDEWLDDWIEKTSNGKCFGAEEAVLFLDPDNPKPHTFTMFDLFLPLTCHVWREVNHEDIAEAILRWKGRWHKMDTTRPEPL